MTELWNDKPPIGAEELARAEQILQKYKVGKAALDQRLVDNELWFRKMCIRDSLWGKLRGAIWKKRASSGSG